MRNLTQLKSTLCCTVRSLHGVSEAAAAEAYFNASLVLAALVTLLFLFWCGEYGSLLQQIGGKNVLKSVQIFMYTMGL
jgi:hypothetical protein